MSLTGANNAAVSALKAQSAALSIISNNLANVSTTGYKASTANFSSLLTSDGSSSDASGGVTVASKSNVTAKGLEASTDSATDLAIDGTGFFVVSDGANSSNTYYTRNGSFTKNDDGYLTNNGYYLLGWPTDTAGNVIGASRASNLEAIDTNNIQSYAAASTKLTLSGNLPANAAVGKTFTTDNIEVYDSLGTSMLTTATWTKLDDNTWGVSYSDPVTSSGTQIGSITSGTTGSSALTTVDMTNGTTVTSGSSFTVGDGTNTATVTFSAAGTYTADEIAAALNGTGTNANISVSYNTSAAAFRSAVDVSSTSSSLKFSTVATGSTAALTITDGSDVLGTSGTFTGGNYNLIVSFNGDGSLASTSPTTPSLQITPTTGADALTVSLNIGTVGASDGVTQLSDEDGTIASTVSANADGVAYGTWKSVSIDDDGTVYAKYSNDETIAIYKIPVATFANADGLQELSNSMYSATTDSAAAVLHLAGTDGTGAVKDYTLEASTTDTSTEFSNMIAAQQAYSAAAQIVTTGKSMFDTLIQAVR